MNILFIIFLVIFGLLIGSFLNVVALRYNTGKSIGGRSECFSCGHTLSWKDLFPLFSFLLQRGRCRYCSSVISIDNIYAEITTGLFFGLIAARGIFSGYVDFLNPEYLVSTIFLFFVFSVLIIIFLYDIKHKIIPDLLSFIFGASAFISLFFFEFINGTYLYTGFHYPDWIHVVAGLLVPLPFFLIWIVSKGKWIGLGDPKLMVGMGFLFGIAQGFSSVFVSFWIGALFAIALITVNALYKKRLMQLGKKSIMKTEIPFAPFLIIATLITIIFDINIL